MRLATCLDSNPVSVAHHGVCPPGPTEPPKPGKKLMMATFYSLNITLQCPKPVNCMTIKRRDKPAKQLACFDICFDLRKISNKKQSSKFAPSWFTPAKTTTLQYKK